MTDFDAEVDVLFDDTDPLSAYLPRVLGRAPISHTIDTGMDISYSNGTASITTGEAYILDAGEEIYAELTRDANSIDLQSGSTNWLYLAVDRSEANSGYIHVDTNRTPPDDASILFGEVNTANGNINHHNREFGLGLTGVLDDPDGDSILEIMGYDAIENSHDALLDVRSNQHHAKPIPGAGIDVNDNVWSVDAGGGGVSSHTELTDVRSGQHHERPFAAQGLGENSDGGFYVMGGAASRLEHDDLRGISSSNHHRRPQPGDHLAEIDGTWHVNESSLPGAHQRPAPGEYLEEQNNTWNVLAGQLPSSGGGQAEYSGDPNRPQRPGYQVEDTSAMIIEAPGMRDRDRVPLHTTQEIHIWVDSNNGNNSWSGASQYPVETLTEAVSRLPLWWLHPITIHVVGGIHNEDVPGGVTVGPAIQGFFTSDRRGFSIVGEGQNRDDTVINNLLQLNMAIKSLGPRSLVQIENITLAATLSNYNSVIGVENAIINPIRSDGIAIAGYGQRVYCFNVRFGVNTEYCCKVKEGAEVIINNCSGQAGTAVVDGPEGTVRDYWDNNITHPAADGVWGNDIQPVEPVEIIHGLVEHG